MLHSRTSLLVAWALIVVVSRPAVAAEDVLQLAPSTKWHVDYSPDSCRLVRRFGEGPQAITLIMDRFGPGDWLKLTVAGPPIRKIGHEGAITLQFGPKEAEQKVGYYLGHLGKDLPALFLDQRVRVTPLTKEEEQVLKSSKVGFVDPARISAERLSAVSELNIGRPLQKPTRLMLGSIKQPLEAMDKCTDELLTHWGIDVAKYKTQSRRLRSRPRSGSWIDWSDYPPKMIEQRRRSILHVRLNVDETGLPTACHVQKSSGPKEFEDAVCGALMKRARFDPALDAEGKPFASVLTQGVTFDIP